MNRKGNQRRLPVLQVFMPTCPSCGEYDRQCLAMRRTKRVAVDVRRRYYGCRSCGAHFLVDLTPADSSDFLEELPDDEV